MKKHAITGVMTKGAVVNMESFENMVAIAKRHKVDVGAVIGVALAGTLDAWAPDFRQSMTSLFGESGGKAVDALHLEGVLTDLHGAKSGESGGGGAVVKTAVDSLADAWTEVTGEEVPGLTRRRIHSQLAGKHANGPCRRPREAAGLFVSLFPDATFTSFATDAYQHAGSIDEAAIAAPDGMSNELRKRWKEIWKIATTEQGESKAAEDPYLFFRCAVNPRFSSEAFRRLLVSYSIWDAIHLATGGGERRKNPDPEAITGISS